MSKYRTPAVLVVASLVMILGVLTRPAEVDSQAADEDLTHKVGHGSGDCISTSTGGRNYLSGDCT